MMQILKLTLKSLSSLADVQKFAVLHRLTHLFLWQLSYL